MFKSKLLRLKSKWFVIVLGILNMLSLSFIIGCSNKTNKENVDYESLAKEKHLVDSIKESNRIKDSIALIDSVNKPRPINDNYKPVNIGRKYGIRPSDYKKIN